MNPSFGSLGSVGTIPLAVLTDSYKATHFLMYPGADKMVAYGEFRTPFTGSDDQRFLFYGIRYVVENYLNHKWTVEEVERADLFYKTHNAGYTPFQFPKELFLKFIKENDGYFPVKLEALPEGTAAHIHTPVYQITAEKEYTTLCTFLETVLTQVWYPTTVATLSRMAKDTIEDAFEKSVDDEAMFLLESRLHDFGFRGCTCVEQSVLGGAAHLLSFTGSDTMSACFYVQFALNGGRPVGNSIPATEHSVMTAWRTEREAVLNMMHQFGTAVFATVMDSYDYERALQKLVPSLASVHKANNTGFWVLRPDSGDPVEAILMALRALDQVFGSTVNKKGFKVIRGAGCIQGDGINKETIKRILEAALASGFSAQNVAFGMGGGLLQKVNRDTMGFATKLSHIRYADGKERDIMKLPKSDKGKVSLPGVLRVRRDAKGFPQVLPAEACKDDGLSAEDLLRVVYDQRPVAAQWDDFDTVRQRAQQQWRALPRHGDPVSAPLKEKIQRWVASQREVMERDDQELSAEARKAEEAKQAHT